MENSDDWRHKSVNAKRLTSLKIGKGTKGGSYEDSGVHLFDKTLSEYIKEDENPRFVLAARKKAPKVSGPNRPNWNGNKVDGMPMHLVTDHRWLIIVGQRAGDSTYEIEFDDISSIEYKTGFVGHKINISTEANEIEIPISNMYDEDLLSLVTSYVKDPPLFDPETHESIVIDSGSDEKSSVKELVNKANHESVNNKRLTEVKPGLVGRLLYDEPLISYLHNGEQPHYIIQESAAILSFSGANPPQEGSKNAAGVLLLVTDERLIILEPDKAGDRMWDIPFDEIESIESESSAANLKTIFIDVVDYTVEIQNLMDESCISALDYIKKEYLGERHSGDNSEITKLIDRTPTSNNTLYAKLIVPTKSSGATFTSKGWNIGGNIVRGTSSKGTIEDENWENYVKKLDILREQIEIGVTHGDLSITSDNQIHQTMRIDLSDISDVRVQRVEGLHGFIFETTEDVYQFKLSRKGTFSTASQADAKGAVESLKSAIHDAPDKKKESSISNSQPTETDSPAEKLSQIKELYDKEVLTDEEFEEKKKELLDQI